MRRLLLLVLCAAAALDAKTIVLRSARLFDGRSNTLQQPGLIIVTDDRIAAVGGSPSVPAGAEVIDLGDATLMPGFMDAHTHIAFQRSDDNRQDRIDEIQQNISERALQAAEYARRTLMAGFTTVRDLGSDEFIDVGLRNAARRALIPGPRVLAAVRSIGTIGGHCDPTNGFRFGLLAPGEFLPSVATGPDGMRAAVRWNVQQGADVIKTCATGGVLSLNDDVDSPQLTQEELNALVDQAHTMRRKAAAHAHGAEGAKRAIRAGIDSIEHGSFLDDEALAMMIQKGTYYVPTLMALQGIKEQLDRGAKMDPRTERKARIAMDSVDATVKKAIARGVRIALGTDSGVYNHGRNAEELGQMVARGMKPLDALKAGTSVTAELFGIAERTGSLRPGLIADIVAVPGNPLEDVRVTEKVFFVMRDGIVFRNDRRR